MIGTDLGRTDIRFTYTVKTHENLQNPLQNLARTPMGIVVWGQAAKGHLNKIRKLQKHVLRLMNFGQYTSHAIPLFISAEVLPIHML